MENIIYCKNVLHSYKYQNKHNVLKTTMIHVTLRVGLRGEE